MLNMLIALVRRCHGLGPQQIAHLVGRKLKRARQLDRGRIVGKQVDKLYSIPGKVPNPINMPNYCYFKDRCEMCVNGCEGDYPCEVSISPTHKVSCYRYYDGKRPDLEEVVEEELAEGKENGKEGE